MLKFISTSLGRSSLLVTGMLLMTLEMSSIALAQDHNAAALDEGFELLGKQNYAAAAKVFQSLIASSEAGSFDPHFGLAVASNRLSKLDQALQHAQRAVDLAATDDQRINGHYQLGLASFREVQAEVEKTISERSSGYRERSENARLQQASRLADASFRTVLQLDRESFPIIWLYLARNFGYVGRYQEALDELYNWQHTQPPTPPPELQQAIHYLRCQAEASRKNPDHRLVEVGPAAPDIVEPKKLSTVPPLYPEAARSQGVQGQVTIEAVIDRSGEVVCTRRLSGPQYGLAEAAELAVSHWTFEPATRSGKPLAVISYQHVSFGLSR